MANDVQTHLERINAALMAQCAATVDSAIEEAVAHGTALMRQRFDAAKGQMVMEMFRNYDVRNQAHELVIRVRDNSSLK